MLDIFKDKPVNKNYILLEIEGDINNPVLQAQHWDEEKMKWYIAKDITNIECTVYNTKTDRMSTKSAYLNNKTNRLYLKSKDGRLYLDEFKVGESDI